MKRTIIIILAIVLMAGILYVLLLKKSTTVGSFDLEEYNEFIEAYNAYFPKENIPESAGEIHSSREAEKAAEDIWKKVYGNSVTWRKPCKIRFDETNQVWFVTATVFSAETGPCILIRESDGKILAIWNYKN